MPSVSIPDLLKAAERPLALFLEDALRHVEPNYWESVVKQYVSSRDFPAGDPARVYVGTETLVDARGQVKTSLQECDLLFLTHLLEFCTMQHQRKLHPTLRYVDLTESLPFTKKSIRSKIIALRDIRNAWSHEQKHTADDQHQMIDLSKMVDLFRVEILHVVQSSEHFTAETRDAVQDIVDKLSHAQGQLAGGEGTSALPPTTRKRVLVLGTILGVILIAVLLLSRSNGSDIVLSPKVQDALVIAVLDPIPTHLEESFATKISELPHAKTREWSVVIIDADGVSQRISTRLTTEDLRQTIVPMLSQAKGLTSIFDYGKRVDTAVKVMERYVQDSVAARLVLLGNLRDYSSTDSIVARQMMKDLGYVTLHKTHFMLEKWQSYRWDPPLFLWYAPATNRDSGVVNMFHDARPPIYAREIIL